MSKRFKLYNVNIKYIRNLHNVDDNVPSISPQKNDNLVEIKLKEDITSYFDKIKNADINFYTFSNGEKRVSILLELQSNLSVEEIEYLVATVSEVTGIRDVDNIVILLSCRL